MAKLIYSLDGAFLGEFPIEKERMTIGRRPDNDIHIDNLAISGEHAIIVAEGGDVSLEDLESTNGTIVNGQPIKKQLLQHGDVIELGKYQLKYIDENYLPGKSGGAAMDYEKTMIIRPAAKAGASSADLPQAPDPVEELQQDELPAPPQTSEAQSSPEAQPSHLPSWARPPSFSGAAQVTSPATPPSAVAPAQELPPAPPSDLDHPAQDIPLARIQVLNGPSAGKELVLGKASTTIGKQGVQVAAISRRPQGYCVSHIEGSRHPVVNGNPVGEEAHPLGDQDVIEIAGIRMIFYFFEV